MQICNKPSELLLIRVLVPRGLLLHYIPPPLLDSLHYTDILLHYLDASYLSAIASYYGLFVVIFRVSLLL